MSLVFTATLGSKEVPPRKAYGKNQATPRRLKGLAKAMEQAGVEWDEKRAVEIRSEASRRVRPHLEEMSRSLSSAADLPEPSTEWFPLPAFLGALLAGGVGYFIGEAALAPYAHPSHWIAAVMAAFFGYAAGFVWQQLREC